MRIWLVLLLVVLVPEGAMAARWEKAVVPVWDFMPQQAQPYIQAAVDDFNATLPPGVPRLDYIPMGELPCANLPGYGKLGGISVCYAPDSWHSVSDIALDGHAISRVRVQLVTVNAACHELMHALTNIADDYANPHLGESCVQGALEHLGSWDIAYAAQVYGERNGHKNTRRRR
jgi:hypothetical protein